MSETPPLPATDRVELNPAESLKDGLISLDFMQQEPLRDYSALIAEAEDVTRRDFAGNRGALRTNYSEMWNPYAMEGIVPGEVNPVIKKELDEALPRSIMCDLGGKLSMSSVAASRDAELFIGVDKYPKGADSEVQTNPGIGRLITGERKSPLTKTVLVPGMHKTVNVQADMLDFVSRLRDGSVNISMNGIDTDVIRVEAYHEAVAKEILRVLKPEGIAFGNNAVALGIIEQWVAEDPALAEQFRVAYSEGAITVIRRK